MFEFASRIYRPRNFVIGVVGCQGGLASNVVADVRNVACEALKQFDAKPAEHHHAMTLRFCSNSWTGLDGDEIPLRPFMERLSAGEELDSFMPEELKIFGGWVCRFRHATCFHGALTLILLHGLISVILNDLMGMGSII